NAIIQAACYGVALRGATLYSTDSPCLLCAKMIVTAGIKEVVFESPYRFSAQTARLLKTAGIRCRRFKRTSRQAQA
ncbi:MAG: cytidine deaminase, partial [Verrucomicrobia bacterium]|nr:cytidine deaminase [Verrucomicrobiota bacterium]